MLFRWLRQNIFDYLWIFHKKDEELKKKKQKEKNSSILEIKIQI